MSCKITFVILHYNNLKETKKCIKSLKKYLINNLINIVVVDNGSTRNSLNSLLQKNDNKHIHYIISKVNLGFAKGNNLGFQFAKRKLKSDIIILTNSDTYFKQKNFLQILNKHYEQGFDVAGPRILTDNGRINQNPIYAVYDTPLKVKRLILKFKFLYFLWYLNLDDFFMKKIVPKIKREDSYQEDKLNDFKLHGACMIFAKDYIKKMDGLYPKTFMYAEEDFLKYIVEKYNFKMKYFSDLVVFHEGGASTKEKFGIGRRKRRFYYKWSLNSLKKLKRYMENNENEKDFNCTSRSSKKSNRRL